MALQQYCVCIHAMSTVYMYCTHFTGIHGLLLLLLRMHLNNCVKMNYGALILAISLGISPCNGDCEVSFARRRTGFRYDYNKTFCEAFGLCYNDGHCGHYPDACIYADVLCTCGKACCVDIVDRDNGGGVAAASNGGFSCNKDSLCYGANKCRARYCSGAYIPPQQRVACGAYAGMSKEDCEQKGCCYSSHSTPQCYFSALPPQPTPEPPPTTPRPPVPPPARYTRLSLSCRRCKP